MLVGEMMSGRTSACPEGATDECIPLVGAGGAAATGVAVRWLPLAGAAMTMRGDDDGAQLVGTTTFQKFKGPGGPEV